jgi:hypothetical protein
VKMTNASPSACAPCGRAGRRSHRPCRAKTDPLPGCVLHRHFGVHSILPVSALLPSKRLNSAAAGRREKTLSSSPKADPEVNCIVISPLLVIRFEINIRRTSLDLN